MTGDTVGLLHNDPADMGEYPRQQSFILLWYVTGSGARAHYSTPSIYQSLIELITHLNSSTSPSALNLEAKFYC